MAQSRTALRANSGYRLRDRSVASLQPAPLSPHPGPLPLPLPLMVPATTPTRAEWPAGTRSKPRHVLRSEPPANSTAVKLGAARNEWVSFQILLRSDAPVKAVRVEAGDLKGSNGVAL